MVTFVVRSGSLAFGRWSLRNREFADAVANLAATLYRRAKDELVGEDVPQRRQARCSRAALSCS